MQCSRLLSKQKSYNSAQVQKSARQSPRAFATGASRGLSTAGCGGALMRLTQEKVSLSYPLRPKDRNMTKLMSALLAAAFAVSLTAAAQTSPPAPAPATPAT